MTSGRSVPVRGTTPNHPSRMAQEHAVTGPASLTRRQWEVMEWVAAGLSRREIEQRMGIGHQTVKNHVTAIFARLGVGTIIDAFRALGWLSPGRPAVEWSVTDGWRVR